MNYNKHNDHPPSFVCPLSLQIMEHPVSCHCAHTFEADAILEWLSQNNDCCPISRKPLTISDLAPNHILAERIEKWQFDKQQQQHPKSYCPKNDNNHDEPTTGDVELGLQNHHKAGQKRHNQYIHYQMIPTTTTKRTYLLPQEEQYLTLVHARAQLQARQQQQHDMLRATGYCLVASMILVGTVGGSVYYYYWQL